MIITNLTEFFYFLNNNGFTNLNPVFARFISSVNDFNGTCGCKAAEKSKKLNVCTQLYTECANVLFSRFPTESFIELRNNSIVLNTIRR
jgi:hypothetical protein